MNSTQITFPHAKKYLPRLQGYRLFDTVIVEPLVNLGLQKIVDQNPFAQSLQGRRNWKERRDIAP
jgi:hypothetical protein